MCAGRRTQIVGCGTGSCHRLSLGHAHEQEGGDLGAGGLFRLHLLGEDCRGLFVGAECDGLVENVTARGNIAAKELVARATAGEVVVTDVRDVNMDGALDCA